MKLKKEIAPLPVPVYFTDISLENLKCFGKRQTISFADEHGNPKQWNIILGENGVGKTSVLRSLVLALSSVRLQNSRQYYASYEIAAKWNCTRYNDYDLPAVIQSNVVIGQNLNSKNEQSPEKVPIEVIAREGMTESGGVGSSLNQHDFRCFGYGATRLMGRTSLAAKDNDYDSASLFDDTTTLRNAEEWLLQLDYLAEKDKNASAGYKDDVIKILKDLLPDVKDIRFVTTDRFKPGVEFKTSYGWVTLDNLSLGYRTLIAWMVDFASRMFQRNSTSKNPLQVPAVLLVDEIDLHLHPKWQRMLITFLTKQFPNTQFIVTAHSPLVIQAAEDANVILLKKKGDEVFVHQEIEEIKNWRIDQILTSELFGLESARPPKVAKLMKERDTLLAKKEMTTNDKQKLSLLDDQIGNLPYSETPEEIKAETIIQQLAAKLGSQPYIQNDSDF